MATRTRRRRLDYQGAAQLAAFIQGHGLSLRAAATQIGVSKTTLIFWLRGDQRPEHPMRLAVERWTSGSVPAASWAVAAEREVVERVRPFSASEAA